MTSRSISRRVFLLGLSGAGAAVLASCATTATTPASTPSPAPPATSAPPSTIPAVATAAPPTTSPPATPTVAATGTVRSYTFDARPFSFSVDGKTVSTWALNEQVPGPEIRLREGDTLRVVVRNGLPEPTTIHWHGLPIPNAMDGVPNVTQPAIKPNDTFTYQFTVPVAGTYMYHSHAGLQLDRGLYGPLIVEPTRETLSYDRESVLVFDDWLDGLPGTPGDAMKQLIADGDRMGMGSGGGMSGMGGMGSGTPAPVPPDVVYPLYLINGRPSSAPVEIPVKKGDRVRLRLINPSGATIYRVALGGHRLTVTHADGQAIEPVEVDALRLGMGERYDVLVTANNPGVWQLAAQVEGTTRQTRAIFRYAGSTGTPPAADLQPPELNRQILDYRMLKAGPDVTGLPTGPADQVVPIVLKGGMGQYVWTINDQVFAKADPLTVAGRRRVRFEMNNLSMMPHPMHLHGHFFQVDNGTGRGPLKDTVLVEPMQRLAIDWTSDNPGSWAFHCHNLYHQEAGMMRVVKVG